MKLLMVTRKVDRNEHLAGFIYEWVKKIGSQVDQLFVLTWQEGDSSGLPGNIKVVSLPTRANIFVKVLKFEASFRQYIQDVDGVFCHQMPLYTILAAPFAKLYRKRIVSWYMHRQIDLKLRLMEKISNVVLSASPESFRLKSKKLVITGRGIDTDVFKPTPRADVDRFSIVSVGRISPTKDYESMIKAFDILRDSGQQNLSLIIAGDVGLELQRTYFDNLKLMVEKMNLGSMVSFSGPIAHHDVPNFLQTADLFINLSGTGSVDKAVLEAMACGCVVLTSNEAFQSILPGELMVEKNNPKALAEKILWIRSLPSDRRQAMALNLREEVVRNHNLDTLVRTIINQFRNESKAA